MATDEPPRLDARQTQRALDRLVESIVKLFGSGQPKPAPPRNEPDQGVTVVPQPQTVATPPPPPSATAALEMTLAQFETMPHEMSELRRSLGEVLHRFEDALDHLGIEAKRLSNESTGLALMADRLQARLSDLERTLNGNYIGNYREAAAREAPVPDEPRAPDEPQFRPSDKGVSVVLASVPGFQGLMDVQRALSGLPEADAASVAAYRNGEATLQLVLRQPVGARQIIDALAQATGEELLIEESRPEAQRLRLRFVQEEGRR